MSIPEEMLQQIQWRQLQNLRANPAGLGGMLPGSSVASALPSLAPEVGVGAVGGGGLATMAPRLSAFATKHPLAAKSLPLLASQLITSQDVVPGHGNVEAFGRGAITGAAAGATAGLAGGPFAGVTVPVGTVAGAAIGGVASTLFNTFFGEEDEPDPKTQLAEAASQFGLDPTQYTAAFDLLSKAGVDKKTLSTQLAQQLLGDAQTKRQTDEASKLQLQQRAGDQRFALAMQAQAQQFFTPYVNNIVTAGASQAELLKSLASQLPAPYRSVMENQAAQAIGQSQRLAGAYAAQASMLPSQYMMSQDVQRQEELARLQYQQSVINSQSGGGAGGADFNSLVQQLTG